MDSSTYLTLRERGLSRHHVDQAIDGLVAAGHAELEYVIREPGLLMATLTTKGRKEIDAYFVGATSHGPTPVDDGRGGDHRGSSESDRPLTRLESWGIRCAP